MSRKSLLAAFGVTVIIALSGGSGASSDLLLSADITPTTPDLVVLDAPPKLELHEAGIVKVKASAPAEAGDPVVLRTAGNYNAGYNQVSESVLGDDLTATLDVTPRDYLGTFNYSAALPATATHAEITTPYFAIAIVKPDPQQSPRCGTSGTLRKADGTKWKCTFDDEFNGPELDRRYWSPQETEKSGFTTGTKTTYACALDSPQTISVEDGVLKLSLVDLGEKRDCTHNLASRYAYGQVQHFQTFSQAYGRFEVRAKIPDLQQTGSQQSFWLWPETDSYGPWPASGEIDFAEMYSSAPGILKPFIHYLPGATAKGTNQNITHTECPIRVGKFNTYALEWEPGRLTILLNGDVCMIDDYSSVVAGDGSPAPFDKPFYLALNQAMGTLGNTYDGDTFPDSVTTDVDYVRVWR